MRIGFVGAGKVGCSLAKYLKNHCWEIVGFYSLLKEDSLFAKEFVGTECYNTLPDLVRDCDTLFLTVQDDSIENVVDSLIELKIKDKIIIHTSGAKSSEVFKDLNKNNFCYSLHPIYAFSNIEDAQEGLKKVCFTLEGNPKFLTELKESFNKMGNPVTVIQKEDKAMYHACCVMVSNFITGLCFIAEELLKKIGFEDLSFFMPLIEQNVFQIKKHGVLESLTGPIVRNDVSTIQQHLAVLPPEEEKIYRELSEVLVRISEIKTGKSYKEMKEILEEKK